jgi:hypothetical protein
VLASHLIGVMNRTIGSIGVEKTTELPPASMLFFDDLEPNIAAARRREVAPIKLTPIRSNRRAASATARRLD